MNRIAKSTDIHGVKEAFYANWVGRLFYAVVFTSCFVLMVFQLKGLVQAYVHDSVGTRLTNPNTFDHVEVPSFFYCNDMWFPNLQGLEEHIRSENGETGRDQDGRHGFANNYFWRKMRTQDLVNDITILPDKGRFDELRPGDGSEYFYTRAHHEMTEMLKSLVGRSLQNSVEKSLSGSRAQGNFTQQALTSQAHGIFPNEFHFSPFKNESSIYELFLKLSKRSGKPLLTLDGICWEFSAGPDRQMTEEVVGQIHQHAVTHVGGLGRHITELVHLYLTTPGSRPFPSDSFHLPSLHLDPFPSDGIVRMNEAVGLALFKAVSMVTMHTHATRVSIATQGKPHLLFDQKIGIDRYAPGVLIKYWTKKSALKSRKGWPCRSEWTDLDQAHCNQRYARERGNLFCDQYLPASHHFQETDITRETCIHDHIGLLSAAEQSGGPHAEFPLKINSEGRQQMLLNLTTNSVRCPRACLKTLFQFDTTYPTDSTQQKAFQCMAALAYFFVPLEDIHEVWWGNQLLQVEEMFSQRRFKTLIFFNAFNLLRIMRERGGSDWPGWPCSVVEFQRSETNGQVSEEYFLYSLSDLAANVGGTVGLWAGASVLSFVQIIYLCCLKKLFKRVEQSMLYSHLTKCVMPPSTGSASGKSDQDRNGSYKKRTRTRNHVHHV